MRINKNTLNNFRNDFAAAVKELEAKYDVSVAMSSIKYTDEDFTAKVVVTNNDESGEKVSIEAKDFERMAHLYGMKPSDLGRTISLSGQRFTITGLKPRNTKMPIIASSNGKSYKLRVAQVTSALNA